ncbi:hypothetical protein ACC713_16605 [Rhizobium johnstonii]
MSLSSNPDHTTTAANAVKTRRQATPSILRRRIYSPQHARHHMARTDRRQFRFELGDYLQPRSKFTKTTEVAQNNRGKPSFFSSMRKLKSLSIKSTSRYTCNRTASFLVETAENIGVGSQPTRTAVFGTNTVRNVSIALMVGAIAVLPAAFALGTVSWITAVLIAEGVKRSEVGLGAANAVRDAINDPTQKKNLLKLAPFILRHEQQLRTIAGDQREFKWLHDWLDWLKVNSSLN